MKLESRALRLYRSFLEFSDVYQKIFIFSGGTTEGWCQLPQGGRLSKKRFLASAKKIEKEFNNSSICFESTHFTLFCTCLAELYAAGDEIKFVGILKKWCLEGQRMVSGDPIEDVTYSLRTDMDRVYRRMMEESDDISVEDFIEFFSQWLTANVRFRYLALDSWKLDTERWRKAYGQLFPSQKVKIRQNLISLSNFSLFNDKIRLTMNISNVELDNLEGHLNRYGKYLRVKSKNFDEGLTCSNSSVYQDLYNDVPEGEMCGIDSFEHTIEVVQAVINNAERGVFPGRYPV